MTQYLCTSKGRRKGQWDGYYLHEKRSRVLHICAVDKTNNNANNGRVTPHHHPTRRFTVEALPTGQENIAPNNATPGPLAPCASVGNISAQPSSKRRRTQPDQDDAAALNNTHHPNQDAAAALNNARQPNQGGAALHGSHLSNGHHPHPVGGSQVHESPSAGDPYAGITAMHASNEVLGWGPCIGGGALRGEGGLYGWRHCRGDVLQERHCRGGVLQERHCRET